MALRILIDASVLVSAAFGGIPAQAVRLSFEDHTVIYSAEVREELCSLPSHLSHKLSARQKEALETLLELLFALGEEVKCASGAPVCCDPKDNVYLWTCQAGSAVILRSNYGTFVGKYPGLLLNYFY